MVPLAAARHWLSEVPSQHADMGKGSRTVDKAFGTSWGLIPKVPGGDGHFHTPSQNIGQNRPTSLFTDHGMEWPTNHVSRCLTSALIANVIALSARYEDTQVFPTSTPDSVAG